LFKNAPDPEVSKEELIIFLVVLIASVYNELPGRRFYWNFEVDVRNWMVYNAITRDRLIQIMKYLHFADNSKMVAADKMWKLRPLIEKLINNFQKHFVPLQELNTYESMVAYYFRHSCKQFIRGKPNRFGYNIWCLNTTNGYPLKFDVYQGKSPRCNEEYETKFGKTASPLVRMIDEFSSDAEHLSFNFYLLKSLHRRKFTDLSKGERL
jgi:DNA excision repair protein ERCC-6